MTMPTDPQSEFISRSELIAWMKEYGIGETKVCLMITSGVIRKKMFPGYRYAKYLWREVKAEVLESVGREFKRETVSQTRGDRNHGNDV